MNEFNKVQLIGRIANKLELKKTVTDEPYLYIRLAIQNIKGEARFIGFNIFGQMALNVEENIGTGSLILVTGFLKEFEIKTEENLENRLLFRAVDIRYLQPIWIKPKVEE